MENKSNAAPAAQPASPPEEIAKQIVGTGFWKTAASHETLERVMIERIADYIQARELLPCRECGAPPFWLPSEGEGWLAIDHTATCQRAAKTPPLRQLIYLSRLTAAPPHDWAEVAKARQIAAKITTHLFITVFYPSGRGGLSVSQEEEIAAIITEALQEVAAPQEGIVEKADAIERGIVDMLREIRGLRGALAARSESAALLNDFAPLLNVDRFLFWVCPKGCQGQVVWDHSVKPEVATCQVCKATSADSAAPQGDK